MAEQQQNALKLHFYGAANTVTGSKFLLEINSAKLLVDCGLFQGKKELRLRNWDGPPFDPQELSAVVLTHAHIDHSGYLPLLVRRGYRGPVYCSPATGELLKLLLPDTARLQEEEARYANQHGTSKHKPAKPLYSEADAAQALRQIRPLTPGGETALLPGVTVRTRRTGHILGSTALMFSVNGARLTFSGDVGRYGMPILPDPEPVDPGDVLICEATYGNKLHESAGIRSELAAVVLRAVERGGPLLVPAFAIGRTQTLLYCLAELEREKAIPELPVFIDSPMAVDATRIYRTFREEYDEEAAELLASGARVLSTERTTFCRSVDESKRLNTMSGPRIIIAGSGMATGGRILHHLMRWLPSEDTTVLFVGYQAEGTRGRTIQSGAAEVKMFQSIVPIHAQIETISALSAHADQRELLRWLSSAEGPAPRQMKVVHGEPEAITGFCAAVQAKLGWPAQPAEDGEAIEL